MKKAEFEKVVTAVSELAEALPDLPYDEAAQMHARIMDGLAKWNRRKSNPIPEDDVERFVAFGDVIAAAGLFYEAVKKLGELGPITRQLTSDGRLVDLEEEITPPGK